MTATIRRVVTVQAPGEKARVFADGPVPNVHAFGEGGPVIFEIWKTFETPSQLGYDAEEPAAGPMALVPPAGGHVFRIADIPPEPDGGVDAAHGAQIFEQMGNAEASTQDDGSHDMMHRTESLDYGIVLEGEIILVLDDEEVSLRAGDVVIQRGSNHAWTNRSGKMARMAFFMSSAKY